jgi:hypothetical protein
MKPDQMQVGLRALQAGDKHEARRVFAALVRATPQDADAWWNLALATEDSEQKARCLQEALRLRPDWQEARGLLASVESKIARPTPARGLSRPVLEAGQNEQSRLHAAEKAVDATSLKPSRPMIAGWQAVIASLVVISILVAVYLAVQPQTTRARPTSGPSERTLSLNVEDCTTSQGSAATLVFVNESGLTVDIYHGAIGEEVAVGTLASGSQQPVEAAADQAVRYSARAQGDSQLTGGATIVAPAGSTCRVPIR